MSIYNKILFIFYLITNIYLNYKKIAKKVENWQNFGEIDKKGEVGKKSKFFGKKFFLIYILILI